MNTLKNLARNLLTDCAFDLRDFLSSLSTSLVLRTLMTGLMLSIGPVAFALPANFFQETVIAVGNLTKPTSVVTLPDGNMLIAEQTGGVKIFDPSTIPATPTTILTIPNVDTFFERGVATLVLDPSFGSNGFFYVYYTNLAAGTNRVSRFTLTGGTSNPGTEVLVWQDNEPAMTCCHFGGGMDFGPDGMLYVTTGEEFDVSSTPPQSQDLTRAGGKIMRLNVANVTPTTPWVPGGANTQIIPADNPDFGVAGELGEIWAYGLRNPFRAHWDITGNRFYIGEVGGNVQATAREDLHIGVAGGNYGWPDCEGQCANPAYEDPIYDYGHAGATPNGGAIAAGVVYRSNNFPTSYQGTFFFSDYVEGYVKYLTFNGDGSLNTVNDFATGAGSAVGMEIGPEGALYVIDYGGTNVGAGQLIRYVYNDGNIPPTITSATGTPTTGPAPLDVTFTAVANDPDNTAGGLSYLWSFGDGTPDVAGATVTHQYASAGNYFAFVRVSDATLTSNSDPIQIQVGTPPVVSIITPTDGATFRAGDTINYSGSVTNGTPPYNYQWNIDFFHNAHIHPGPNSTQLADSFQISTSGHDYFDTTGYTLKLTVTDDVGLNTTTEVSIFPEKVDMNLSTVPAGLDVFVDGLSVSTIDAGGIDYDTVISFEHLISVPATVCNAGDLYNFSNWSGFSAGQPRVHALTVPVTNLDLVANYTAAGTTCATVPVQAGLMAYYEADIGVASGVGDVVSSWADQSGQANDLTVQGDPVIISGALNGSPVIDFDGTDDELQRLLPTGLPTGADERTMYLIANYRGGSFGGVAFGDPASNEAFGLVTNPGGQLTVQGYVPINDYSIGGNVRNNWLVQSVVVDNAGMMQHYQDGVLIDTKMHTYATGSSILTLGAELSGIPATMDMQIAAVLIYNRALSAAEQASVQDYLQVKYFGSGGSVPPVANDDFTSVVSGSSPNINVLGNDTDANGDIDIGSVVVVGNGTFGTATANPDGTIAYAHGGSGTSDTFTYTVNDLLGATSNTATVTVTFSTGGGVPVLTGLVGYFEADVGVTSAGNVVSGWSDLSGLGNDLVVLSGGPTIVPNALNGHPVVDFDGVDDRLHKTTPAGFPDNADNRTAYMVANYQDGAFGGMAFGAASTNSAFGLVTDVGGSLTVQGYGITNDFTIGGNVRNNWLVQSAVLNGTELTHYSNGTLIDTQTHTYATGSDLLMLGAELSGGPSPMDMQIAAVLVYDRALSTTEQATVQGYLQAKYFGIGNQMPVAVNDSANAPSAGVARIVVLGNDTDDGTLVPSSVTVVSPPANGRALANADGTITYLSSGVGGSDSFTYTVDDDLGATSNIATVMLSLTPRGNLPPVAANDAATTVNGGMANVMVLANDTDTDGEMVPSSVAIVMPASNGTAVANTDGTITYTHNSGAATSDSFTYTVDDNNTATSNVATVSVTVDTGGGSAPVGISDSATVATGGTVAIDLIANDTDVDDNIDGSTLAITTQPSEGTLFDNNDGTVDYMHTGVGTSDNFEYTVMDTTSLISNVTQVSITITSSGGGRVTADQQVLYTFSEGSGTTVADESGLSPALNLSIQNAGAVTWGSGTLSVDTETSLQSGAATRLSNAVISTNEVTVEAWVAAANTTQTGPARMVSLSTSTAERNVTLGQVGNLPNGRLRTTTAGLNGASPSLSGTAGSLGTNLAHVVYTRASNGTATLYVDNVVVGTATIGGDLSTWSTAYSLILANEFGTSRAWLGEFDLVAIYSRALTSAEVAQNFAAGANGSGGAMGGPPAPLAPLASSDAATVVTGGFVITNVASNDTDANGNLDAATVALTSNGSEGTATANGDGSVTYVHTGGGTTDTYEYTVMDTTGLTSNVAAVTVSITGAAGVAPVATDDAGSVASGGSVNVNVVTNDTDANNDLNPATVVVTSNGSEGTATSNGDGTIAYVHTGSGTSDSFEYTVMDFASLTSNVAKVTVSITESDGGRVTAGQQVLYTFGEGGGNIVADQSGLSPSLNLVIQNPGAVTWGAGTLNVTSSTSLESGVATRLSDAVKASNEVTVEAWVKAANTTQNGPARIVSLSESTAQRNVTLGQITNRADARLRTTTTGFNGASPSLRSSSGSLATSQAHVVYTRASDGTATLYINNVNVATAQIGGDLSTWSGAYKLILANEYGSSRTWLGEYDLIAIYSRALSSAEISQNFAAGN